MTLSASSPEQGSPPEALNAWREWLDFLATGLLFYYLTSLIPILAVVFGHELLRPAPNPLGQREDLLAAFANWDGRWYSQIVREGYSYNPDTYSTIAFFPAFPVLAWGLVQATGLRPDMALLVVAHVSLAGTFVLLAAYLRRRLGDKAAALTPYVLLSLGLLPMTFFCRMAYSESLFLFCAVLVFYGMHQRWPLLLLACLVGLATAVRPVGVALLVPLMIHIWRSNPSAAARARNLSWALPLACWGLVAFMLYQLERFGDPLAFVKTQEHWRVRPPAPLADKLWSLATLEPLWCQFLESSPCYWERLDAGINPLFSPQLANLFFFVAAAVLILLGAVKGWLSLSESVFSVCLLLIPYGTRSHEMCLGAMGRFTVVVFPMYLVCGQLLSRLPAPVATAVLCLSGFLLGVYAAMFAAWYRFF